MLFTCSPQCADPSHHHAAAQRLSRQDDDLEATTGRSALATRAPTKARATATAKSATRKVVKNSKGKHKVVDIHCHYLNPVVNQKTAHLNAAQYDPTVIYANELTNQTNVKQMKDRAPKLTGIEQRIKDMDRMGVDIQAVCPAPYHYFYFTEAGYGAELAREVNEGIASLVAQHPDRFVGLGSVPLQNAELAVQELEYAVKKLGLRGVEINTNVNGMNLTDPRLGLEKFFCQSQRAWHCGLHAPLGFHPGRATHQPLFQQRHRQPTGHHGGGEPFDF